MAIFSNCAVRNSAHFPSAHISKKGKASDAKVVQLRITVLDVSYLGSDLANIMNQEHFFFLNFKRLVKEIQLNRRR